MTVMHSEALLLCDMLKQTRLDDGWANVTRDPGQSAESSAATQKSSSTLDSAKDVVTGAAKVAYGTAAAHVEEGKAAMRGNT